MISTKKMQLALNAEILREAVKYEGQYQYDIEKLIKSGKTDFLVSARVTLGGLLVESPDADNPHKEGIDICNGEDYIVLEAITSNRYYDPSDDYFHSSYKDFYEDGFGLNLNFLSALSYGEYNGPEDTHERQLIKEISELSDEIKTNFFCDGWSIVLNFRKPTKMSNELLEKIIELLKEVKSKLDKESIYNNVTLRYEVVHDVLALNLIKLIKKGTDNEVTMFTGECTGMVIEALTVNNYLNKYTPGFGMIKKYNDVPSRLIVLKSYKPTELNNNDRSIGTIHSEIFRDISGECSYNDIVFTDTDGIKCTRFVDVAGVNIQSTQGIKNAIAAVAKYSKEIFESITQNRLVSDSVANSGNTITREDIEKFRAAQSSSDKIIVLSDKGHLAMMESTAPLTMERLILPKGRDLSASFKAKYI